MCCIMFSSSFIFLKGSLTNSVKEQGETLQTMVDRLADELRQNENTVAQSQDHAQQLEYEADALDRTLRSTKAYAERAVAAATAYKNIEGSLQDALKATEKAKADAGNATKIVCVTLMIFNGQYNYILARSDN